MSYGSYNKNFNQHWKWLSQADTLKEKLRFNEKYAEELKDWEKYQSHLRKKSKAKQKAVFAKDVALMAFTGGMSQVAGQTAKAAGQIASSGTSGGSTSPLFDFAIDSALDGLFKTKQMINDSEFMNMHASDFARLRKQAVKTQDEFDAAKKGELIAQDKDIFDYVAPIDAQGNVSTILGDLVAGPQGKDKGGWDYFKGSGDKA